MNDRYTELCTRLREAATLETIAETLGWDQETMMPPSAAGFRAEELSLLARLAHERATDPALSALLADCEADRALTSDPAVTANLREIRRDYERASKLPVELVAEISETNSLAMEAWKQSRSDRDFASFLPWLGKQIELNRRKADCYGIPEGGERYDALLEDFEPGMTSVGVEKVFAPLRDELVPLIGAIAASSHRPDPTPLTLELPLEQQVEFNRVALQRVGFDLRAGRLDTSTHPFSTGLGPGDTRITTRYRSNLFFDGLGSTMHEAGHALYEQGLPKAEHHGQPLAQPLGLGIHESQSRLWENHVGRSAAFWRWAQPEVARIFGAPLSDYAPEALWAAANVVEPNLIRVESDEATYNLHIMLRFEIERALIRDDLQPADVPAAWNERMSQSLGLTVPDDARGCLQDVHWSMGAIGYFPSYTLGSLYAAQMWETLVAGNPGVEGEIARGEFGPVLDWLRSHVHAHGRRYPADELCRSITGQPLGHEPLMRHLHGKLGEIYGL